MPFVDDGLNGPNEKDILIESCLQLLSHVNLQCTRVRHFGNRPPLQLELEGSEKPKRRPEEKRLHHHHHQCERECGQCEKKFPSPLARSYPTPLRENITYFLPFPLPPSFADADADAAT